MADSDREEFFDCSENVSGAKPLSNSCSAKGCVSNGSVLHPSVSLSRDLSRCSLNGDVNSADKKNQQRSVWGGRVSLPVPAFSRANFSVWSILKQCIGKELSKITMPVVFNEPLSFLQRVVEYMEYSSLIVQASDSADPIERLEFVTAFAASATASNWDRTGKPFNPLLGETYELNREDLGFRIVCEQVSHHPPISAFHVDAPLFTFHGAINTKIKFWGKSVEVIPKGLVTLYLKKHDEAYSWQNVNCCVHNIIVGKLWIEHYGAMEVTNHKNKFKSILNFRTCGWFGKDLHKVEGYMYDNNKQKLRAFYGKWIEALFSHDVTTWEAYLASPNNALEKSPNLGKSSPNKVPNKFTDELDDVPDEVLVRGSTCDLDLRGQKVLWVASPKPPNASQYHSFTLFALLLNELDNDLAARLPPTDCRFRPDIRRMEEGNIDASAEEKNRLEEKQRRVQKDRKKRKDSESDPLWFKCGTNPYTGKEDWICTGEYWKRDWRNCPDLY